MNDPWPPLAPASISSLAESSKTAPADMPSSASAHSTSPAPGSPTAETTVPKFAAALSEPAFSTPARHDSASVAVTAVILAGGDGTRLWPVSRSDRPKPFLTLPDGSTLFGAALKRAARLPAVTRILIVTRREFFFLARDIARNEGFGGTSPGSPPFNTTSCNRREAGPLAADHDSKPPAEPSGHTPEIRASSPSAAAQTQAKPRPPQHRPPTRVPPVEWLLEPEARNTGPAIVMAAHAIQAAHPAATLNHSEVGETPESGVCGTKAGAAAHRVKTEDIRTEDESSSSATEPGLAPVRTGDRTTARATAAHDSIATSPSPVLFVMPADHRIANDAELNAAVERAIAAAIKGHLVVFGLPATSPETGFGYIELEEPLSPSSRPDAIPDSRLEAESAAPPYIQPNSETIASPDDEPPNGRQSLGHSGKSMTHGSLPIARFREKPDAKSAAAYVASGRHLWNAGLFAFCADTLLDAVDAVDPSFAAAATRCWTAATYSWTGDDRLIELPTDSFSALPNISIDHALLEALSIQQTGRIRVIPSNFEWADIGSWPAYGALLPADDAGNRQRGDVELLDCATTTVVAEQRLVAGIGLRDITIVETADAVLIARNDAADQLRTLVATLQSRRHPSVAVHRTVHRPWGCYTVLEEGPRYKIKRIVVHPGEALSLQRHHHRSEHWVVISGMAEVVCGETTRWLQPNESTYIPAGSTHRLANPGRIDCVMIEVQCGDYVGEDDIERLEDRYRRTRHHDDAIPRTSR
ncbi:MAG: sugar phosphate nucleotidyltransferase [Thioalkalivibrionaceae bacterium]